jgi:hypothetical protein
MEASSMCGLASGSLGASCWPPRLCASRAELPAQNQAVSYGVLQALGPFVLRSACCGSRPLRKRSSRVSPSVGRRFQVVVGASRRSAAPGSQYWSAAKDGSAGLARLRRPELRSTMLSRASRQASSVAFTGATPNPSMERTLSGKPVSASHVKRWASR